jgi:hypothetical protein
MEVGEMLADEVDFVIGVDTHRDAHALAVVSGPTGGVVLVEPWLASGASVRSRACGTRSAA